MIDLDAYFNRIGYTGPRTATLDTLSALHAGHTQTIAFENLDSLLGREVDLDLAALEQKLVRDGRGGYCFEHNTLFAHVLERLGFHVKGLAARVLWQMTGDVMPPHTHMLLCVELDDGAYIADVGFGGMTLTAPLHLAVAIEQPTPHEPFRLIKALEESYRLQARLPGGWKTLYQFDLQPQQPADYEMYNYYVSHHPESRFVSDLIVARPAPQRRYALYNNELTIHRVNEGSETRRLCNAAELRTVLEETFQLTLPQTTRLVELLQRAISQADRA